MALIYDLKHETGVAEILVDPLSAAEMVERDPKRYVRQLPPDTKLGPRHGLDRIVIGIGPP